MALALRRYPKVPKFLLFIFFILSILKSSISWFLHKFSGPSDFSHLATSYRSTVIPEHRFTDIIFKTLPIVKFKDIVSTSGGIVDGCTGESCAVCLCEFEGDDEIRLLKDCRHVFHKSCLDDWIGYDHRSCPLCRTPFLSIELEKTIAETLGFDSSIMSNI